MLRPLLFIQGDEAHILPIDGSKAHIKQVLDPVQQPPVATEGSDTGSIPTTT